MWVLQVTQLMGEHIVDRFGGSPLIRRFPLNQPASGVQAEGAPVLMRVVAQLSDAITDFGDVT